MLPDGEEKESTASAPAGAGYLAGSSELALGEGDASVAVEVDDGLALAPGVGPS